MKNRRTPGSVAVSLTIGESTKYLRDPEIESIFGEHFTVAFNVQMTPKGLIRITIVREERIGDAGEKEVCVGSPGSTHQLRGGGILKIGKISMPAVEIILTRESAFAA